MGLARRFAFISLLDVRRFAFAALPTGIYPIVIFVLWRRLDRVGRTLLVSTGLIFAMYYLIATSSLHYFVPAMVFPLAVFWRHSRGNHLNPIAQSACIAGVALAVWSGLPRVESIYTTTRDLGRRVAIIGFDDYRESGPSGFAATERLNELFPVDAHPDVPERLYGGSPLAWQYYSRRDSVGIEEADYIVAPAGTRVDGVRVAYQDSVVMLFVRDDAQYERDRVAKPRGSQGRPIYAIDRDVVFFRREVLDRPGYYSPGLWAIERFGLEIK